MPLWYLRYGWRIAPWSSIEALQAGVLVITADVGGMAEYVHHEARTECVPKDTEGEVLVLNVAMGNFG